ncbi:Histone-lysine N-methyltransferase, H3 lysine-9 specific SUVH4 [Morus notabilis]|uniref:Histone-lysine N-methyltransferase, H3 lysine-9 specific SUVH4 n=2 Tax=Morus notabilis TaxID=981085 RepID=W9RBM0_9ROSA|nr:Histone-lysine N-methyltransferase, H3 lysine-9 specific SUVH4 [Morus notabilis]
MVAVGIHGHWLAGICFIGESEGKKKYKDSGYVFPVGVAIVLSGQYEDDVDNSDEIVYTGQGGHDLLGNKRQIKDQVMKRGNLALKNNMIQSLPIRVIRGNDCPNSITKRLYTYDGLYKVDEYWAERGVSGFTVFKYRLKRLPGQPELVTNQVQFVRGKGSQAQSEIHGLICKDISYGRETLPVPATNIVDDSPETPEGFTYINSIEVASNVKIPPSARGCNCKDECTDPRTCACAKRNPSDFPYVAQDGGRLVEAMDVVFECGPNCGCGPKCVNRTSQKGLKYRLEVYRTPDKGWAVRSWDYIPSGAPVCEYIGVVRRTDEVDSDAGNPYIFEIDCLQTINEIGGRERRWRDVSLPSSSGIKRGGKTSENVPEYCIDAGSRGNVARFINHSCEPNLFVQCVLSSHHDIRLARVVLFAADNIVPLQELTYDYGFELDSVVGPDGKIKKLPCHCGAPGCRKWLH